MTTLVPDACGSDEEHRRFFHDDLESLDEIACEIELHDLTDALASWPPGRGVIDREWMLERRGVFAPALSRCTSPRPPRAPRIHVTRTARMTDEFRPRSRRRREWS